MRDALDRIDEHILYHLGRDARRTSAPDITADVDVSAATIRNRIKQLEDRGVILGYHANIDYERTGGKLTYLFICNADPARREYFAREALQIPGVVHVRELMSGRRNLHIEAIGGDRAEITRIARDLSNLGFEIEDEALVQRDVHNPYHPFGPDAGGPSPAGNLTNLRELAGEATLVDITVADTAEANGLRIRDLSERGLLPEELLIISIERGDEIVMPNGETELQAGDLVTVLSQERDPEELTGPFSDTPARVDRGGTSHEM